MPHVIVKLYPGRSEEQKIKLADEIVKDVVAIAQCEEKSGLCLSRKLKRKIGPKRFTNQIFLMVKEDFTKSRDIILLNKIVESATSFSLLLSGAIDLRVNGFYKMGSALSCGHCRR